MAKVSAIIPVYNTECFIQEAIESVLSQTYKDIELIIVDDASNDRTGEIARSFGSRLTCISHSANMGPSAARNTGIKHALGKYIAFLDADDVWMPDKIKEQMELLENNNDIALVYSNGYTVNSSGSQIGRFFDTIRPKGGFIFKELLLDNFIVTSSVIVRKDILNEIGGFNERFSLSEDFDLYLRIAEHYKIDFVDAPLLKHRIHSGSLSKKKRKFLLDNAINITGFYRDRIMLSDPRLARKLDKRIAKYMFYIAICSLECGDRQNAVGQYLDCIKTGAFDYKVLFGAIFFIMPRFVSLPLVRKLMRIRDI